MQDGFLKHADNYDIRRFCLVIGCEWLRRQSVWIPSREYSCINYIAIHS